MGIDEIKIGTKKENDMLKPELVEIQGYDVIKNEKVGSDVLNFICKHPKKDTPLRISTCLVKNEGRVEAQGTWITLDSEGNIPYLSGVARIMRLLECETIKDLIGKKVMVDRKPDSMYLGIRAY